LAETLDAAVTLTTDAAFPHQLVAWGADTLLVGADAVLPDGRVVNTVGTRGAALSAAREGVDVVVATSVDKVRRDGGGGAGEDPDADTDLEPRAHGAVYNGGSGDRGEGGDGDSDPGVVNPTFDVTPADAVTVVGEDGPVDPIAAATVHHRHAVWRVEDGGDGTDGAPGTGSDT
jgi:translation initiation factor 2B subunit (eIF-2B alpha/beta/delta family)